MPQQYETRRIDVGAVALNVIDTGDGPRSYCFTDFQTGRRCCRR
jgi:hypothetical protein